MVEEHDDSEAVEALRMLLNEDHAGTRKQAAKTFGWQLLPSKMSTERMSELILEAGAALDDGDEGVRSTLLETFRDLARFFDGDELPHHREKLRSMLADDPSPAVRIRAMRAFLRGRGYHERREELGVLARIRFLEGLADPDPQVQSECASQLMAYPEPAVAENLASFIENPSASPRGIEAATITLNRLKKDHGIEPPSAFSSELGMGKIISLQSKKAEPEEVAGLLKALDNSSEEVRLEAALALVWALSSRVMTRLEFAPVIEAVASGHVPFYRVGKALEDRSLGDVVKEILQRVENAPPGVKEKVLSEADSLNEYVDRMSRLY